MRRSVTTIMSPFILILAAAACANPADDVPTAAVSEPQDAAAPASAGQVYEIAGGSKLEFTGSKITGSHEGGFNEFEGFITLVEGNPTLSSVELRIDTTSLWSDSDRLTGHLKSPDFFDVETHPTATFESTSIEKVGDDYHITGNLDLHGVTKSISFPARIAHEPGKVTAQAEFSIKRFDFDIVYPGKPDDLIRDEVVVRFDLVATPSNGAGA